MIYVKFDANNKSTEMRTEVDAAELINYTQIADDSLFGKRLIKSKTKVREFTQAEYAAEAAEIDTKQKAVVIDNMSRELLKQSSSLVEPDVYETYTADQKAAVKQYRDALRDVSKQAKYPEHVDFPDKPIF